MSQPASLTMIFHIPYSLEANPKSASGIRPNRMLAAFKSNGIDVHVVAGTPTERKRQIRDLKRMLRKGLKIDFVYSEAATSPTGVNRPFNFDTSFTRDINFLLFCKQLGIPVGVFYRDIYWQFPVYNEVVKWPLSAILRGFYRWDLRRYRRGDFIIYLPLMKMENWVPIIEPSRFRELGPGATLNEVGMPQPGNKLRLLYVGGLGGDYRLHETVKALAGRQDVELTLCTREAEWAARKHEYEHLLADNVRVVHLGGAELDAVYAQTDACVLAVEPMEYWEFAVPFKLLEYTGYGKPVIASAGTYPAEFVASNGLGWVVRYGTDDLVVLVENLVANPLQLVDATERVRTIRAEHTWEARAAQAVRDLVE